MKGQLWQECETCGTEPACAACFKCGKHCHCDAEDKEIKKYGDEKQAKLNALLEGMDELIHDVPRFPSDIKETTVGEKVDFSPFGGGVYQTYTPILYTSPSELAGQHGVKYWYYIGGDEPIVTTKYWIARHERVASCKAAADAWLAVKAKEAAAEEILRKERMARYEKERASETERKNKEAEAKATVAAIIPKLLTMTKDAILIALKDLWNRGIICQSWSKARIIETITKHVAAGQPSKAVREEDEETGPDRY
jgi:hypothetical protein